MIKAESYKVKDEEYRTVLCINVITSLDDDDDDPNGIGKEIFKAELVSIFKQLHTIDPEIILDALELYKEELEDGSREN